MSKTKDSNKKPSEVFMNNEGLLESININNRHIETLNNCLFKHLQGLNCLSGVEKHLFKLDEMESLNEMLNSEINEASDSLNKLYESLLNYKGA